MSEGIESLRVLFERPRSTYEGKYRRFVDVESYPKPVQTPLPIVSGGNGKGALQRAGERCEGWLPAKIGPAEIAAGRAKVATYACAAGATAAITIGLQSVCMHRRYDAGGTQSASSGPPSISFAGR